MGAHPDGEIEPANYRIKTGTPLTAAEILRQERLGDLRVLLEGRLRKENPYEFDGADPEWVGEVLSWVTKTPLLTRDGILFRYAVHHYDLQVMLPYGEAVPFLQPFILEAVSTRTPPN